MSKQSSALPRVLSPEQDGTVLMGRDLSMVYGDQTVLDVPGDIQIGGGITALVGASGSGKSTLLNILAGFVAPTRGEVAHYGTRGEQTFYSTQPTRVERILGKVFVQLPRDKRTSKHRSTSLGYISQQPALHPELSLADYVVLTHGARGNKIDHRYTSGLIKHLAIASLLDKAPRQLSGGEEQRGAIVAALAHKPKIVFADEPASALDSASSIKAMELFRDTANSRGTSFIIVSHDPAVTEYADRVVTLENGRILSDETK